MNERRLNEVRKRICNGAALCAALTLILADSLTTPAFLHLFGVWDWRKKLIQISNRKALPKNRRLPEFFVLNGPVLLIT